MLGTSNSQVLLCRNKTKRQPPASSTSDCSQVNYTLLFDSAPNPGFI